MLGFNTPTPLSFKLCGCSDGAYLLCLGLAPPPLSLKLCGCSDGAYLLCLGLAPNPTPLSFKLCGCSDGAYLLCLGLNPPPNNQGHIIMETIPPFKFSPRRLENRIKPITPGLHGMWLNFMGTFGTPKIEITFYGNVFD